MRIGRLLVGAAIILFALWVIIGEQITGVSSDAVVNARLTTVRAPIAGVIDMPMHPFGAKVALSETLATLADPTADSVRLNDLRFERAFASAEIARIEGLIGIADADIAALLFRLKSYVTARSNEVDVRVSRAGERAVLLGHDAALDEGLSSSGAGMADETSASAATIELSRTLEELETSQIGRAAIAGGVFLGDGYNDTPASGLRLMELESERGVLDLRLTETRARLAALETRIADEQASVAQLSDAVLTAPSEGIVWAVLASDGEVVQRGQDILKLMMCDSALVTLSVPDHVYNRLQVGQPAKFRLNGVSRTFDGTITRIAGSGAETIYRNLAVAPSIKHLERYDVALLVPALREDTSLRCTVGQTGRVFFETRPLDRLRDILN